MSTEDGAFKALTEYIHGYWMTQATYVVAELAIPDLIGEGSSKTVAELAKLTGTKEGPFRRFLVAAASLGILKVEDDKVTLLPIGNLLRSDHPRSQRHVARLNGNLRFKSFAYLLEGIQTGESPMVTTVLHKSYYEYLREDPREAEVFNGSMTEYSSKFNNLILDKYPLQDGITLFDVGGGAGTFSVDIKKRYPNTKVILCDTAVTQEKNEKNSDLKDIEKRVINFFESVPAGGNVYVLKNIVHDHSDELTFKLFSSMAKALRESPGSKLLIMETMIPESGEANYATIWLDVCIHNFAKGEVRSVGHLREMLEKAGMQVDKVIPLPGMSTDNSILEVTVKQ